MQRGMESRTLLPPPFLETNVPTDVTVRLSIEVPTEVNEKLARYLPWGTKADAIRSLVELFLRECAVNEHAASYLLKGRYKLTVQNLNEASS